MSDFMNKLKFKIYKFVVFLCCVPILDKVKRQNYRNAHIEKYLKKAIKNVKWGVSYSVFEGEELLEPSLLSIRDSVDYINVVYQIESWTRKYKNRNIVAVVENLRNKGLIDEIIEYKPNTNLGPSKNEIKKRNLGLKYAKKAGCNYFMTMDVDEFYVKSEIEKVKKDIIENDITHSYCSIVQYGTIPTKLMHNNHCNFAVSLFCKIGKFSRLQTDSKQIAIVDPKRRMSNCLGSKYFFFCDIMMHHMSYVRNNLEIKLRASSNAYVNNIEIENVKNLNLACVDVEDKFNIMPYLNKQE